MRIFQLLVVAGSLAACAAARASYTEAQDQQRVMANPDLTRSNQSSREIGVGHFSEWSRETKRQFLIDWQQDRASDWIIVLGNEGGDLDSMTAALTWAYHLE